MLDTHDDGHAIKCERAREQRGNRLWRLRLLASLLMLLLLPMLVLLMLVLSSLLSSPLILQPNNVFTALNKCKGLGFFARQFGIAALAAL